MWVAIYDFLGKTLGSIFSFLKPETTNWQAVIKSQNEVIVSMQSRIDTMDGEFKKAVIRGEEQAKRNRERIEALEGSEERCRKSLNKARTAIAVMRGQIKLLHLRLQESEKVKVVKDNPVFHDMTVKQTEVLIAEHTKATKVEPMPPLE